MDNISATNHSSNESDFIHHMAIKVNLYALYAIIFIVGLLGNVLVCFVVCTNKAMQTVTNLFIANLALSDILLCAIALPFTLLYFYSRQWIFGELLCHLVAYSQGTSVYVSTLTLTSIAIDRYFVILYPFKPRMKIRTCTIIIFCIWFFALGATLPYGIFMGVVEYGNSPYCEETWPSDTHRKIFGAVTTVMQFVVPFIIITFAYTEVSLKLSDRSKEKAKIRLKSCRGEEVDRERKRRTNRMLIAMVTIFGICWLPLNVVNLLSDLYHQLSWSTYYNLFFFLAHTIAMSSTCYNVFLYAWLNDSFRKELKRVLPFFSRKMERTSNSRMSHNSLRHNGNAEDRASKKALNKLNETQILLPDGELVPEVRAEVNIPDVVEMVPMNFTKGLLDTSTCPQCLTSTPSSFIAFDELVHTTDTQNHLSSLHHDDQVNLS